MPYDPAGTKAQRERIDQMIEQYRVAKQRRLMRRAMRLWRQAETDHQLVKLDAPPERVH
jgi:DNA-binding transcriptional regulator YbjK